MSASPEVTLSMRPLYYVFAGDNLDLFDTETEMVDDLEQQDIASGEYTVYDSEGFSIELRLVELPRTTPPRTERGAQAFLAHRLRLFPARLPNIFVPERALQVTKGAIATEDFARALTGTLAARGVPAPVNSSLSALQELAIITGSVNA